MIIFFRKYAKVISTLLLLTLLILLWLFPAFRLVLWITFLILTFAITSFIVVEKHKQAYKQASISHQTFIRRAVLEMLGILLVMLFAGLLGSYLAGMATTPLHNQLARFIGGIVIGLLVGIGVGFSIRRLGSYILSISWINHRTARRG